jgi:hypothetical protein
MQRSADLAHTLRDIMPDRKDLPGVPVEEQVMITKVLLVCVAARKSSSSNKHSLCCHRAKVDIKQSTPSRATSHVTISLIFRECYKNRFATISLTKVCQRRARSERCQR